MRRSVDAWHESGLATPLLIAAHEFERSLDAFPVRVRCDSRGPYRRCRRESICGARRRSRGLAARLRVQARSHLLHLREGYLEPRPGRRLSVLIVRSAAPFAAS
jgi:hypothetical protein